MLPDLSSTQAPYFNISAGYPAEYKGAILPGATVMTGRAKEGTVVIQGLKEDLINIELISYQFHQAVQMTCLSDNLFLHTLLSLKNSFQLRITDKKYIRLRQDQIIILPATKRPYEFHFEKRNRLPAF